MTVGPGKEPGGTEAGLQHSPSLGVASEPTPAPDLGPPGPGGERLRREQAALEEELRRRKETQARERRQQEEVCVAGVWIGGLEGSEVWFIGHV